MVTLQAHESIAWCVPNGYGCPSPTFGTNHSDPSQFYNSFAQKNDLGITTAAYAMDNIFDQSTLSAENAASYSWAAYPLQIRWKDSDFPTTTGSTTPTSGTAVPGSVPATSSPSSLPTASGPSSSQGLSRGAIAAIAVVVSIVVLAVIAFLFWCLRRRSRERSRLRQPSALPRDVMNQYDAAMQQDPSLTHLHAVSHVVEAYGGLPADSELEAHERAQELDNRADGRRSVAELG
ncbi:hypothetical protein MMC26_000937 [Xylographa opegraphella]|nr:hypothetical protein [Xylographa opegraphella]